MNATKGRSVSVLSTVAVALAAVTLAGAHCQIPCGIYDDEARFAMMLEHVATIEKSIRQIDALGKEAKPDWNQLVRWVGNKDQHADELSEIVTYYFMAQRIKPPSDATDEKARAKYVSELELLHGMLVRAMKAKQTTDLAHVEELRRLIGAFRESYLGGR